MHLAKWKKKKANLKSYTLILILEKVKLRRQEIISGCQGLREAADEQAGQRNFRTVNLLCTTLSWWTRVIIRLSKPIRRATASVNPK